MKKIDYTAFLKWENKLKKKDVLLDIGCWTGINTARFNKKCDAWGMDIDRDKLNSANPNIKNNLKYGDVTQKIPFTQKFDYCILSEVLEHLDNDQQALDNINQCLKYKGKLILTTPRQINYLEFWDPAWIRWKLGIGGKHRHYSIEDLNRLLSQNGFKIETYAIGFGLDFILTRWANIFLKHILQSKKIIKGKVKNGYFDLCIIAKKIK
ncbi:MAG: class I SAM-dependent methyltransferase [Candidatus Diapherotrites archaeon]